MRIIIIALLLGNAAIGTMGCSTYQSLPTNSRMDISLVTNLHQNGIEKIKGISSTCGLELIVTGGKFSPDICQFEIISRGVECKDPSGCKPDYALALKNTHHNINEINSVVLFNFKDFKNGTYTYDPGSRLQDFRGQLIDKGAIARHLLSGVVTLDRRADNEVFITCDVLFHGNISLQASGLIPVKQVFAP